MFDWCNPCILFLNTSGWLPLRLSTSSTTREILRLMYYPQFRHCLFNSPPLAPFLRHLSPAVTFRLYVLQNAAIERSYYPTPNHQAEEAPFIGCPQLLVLMPFISGSHVLLLQSEGLVTRDSLNIHCHLFIFLPILILKRWKSNSCFIQEHSPSTCTIKSIYHSRIIHVPLLKYIKTG